MDNKDCVNRVKELMNKKLENEMFQISMFPDDKSFRNVIYAVSVGTFLDRGFLRLVWSDGEREDRISVSRIKELKLIKMEQCAQHFNVVMELANELVNSTQLQS